MLILICVISVLQYCALDDRMAVITRTLSNALGDLVPFAVLFFIFLIVFALTGHMLYGPVLDEWATFPGATTRTFGPTTDLIMTFAARRRGYESGAERITHALLPGTASASFGLRLHIPQTPAPV